MDVMSLLTVNLIFAIGALYVLPALVVCMMFFSHIKHKHGYITYGDVIGVSIISLMPGVNMVVFATFMIEIMLTSEDNAIKKFLDKKAF